MDNAKNETTDNNVWTMLKWLVQKMPDPIKNGIGIDEIFDAIVNRITPPKENIESPSRALIFDSTYDNYRGAIPYVRVIDGFLKAGSTAKFFGHQHEYEITEVGHFIMKMIKSDELRSGDELSE